MAGSMCEATMLLAGRPLHSFALAISAGIVLVLGVIASPVHAAGSYPDRPIRLIVPFPPGGSNDVVSRVVAEQLGERLGQQVVVDNRGGAGATIGTELASRAEPDGYTLLFISTSFAANSSLYRLPYDPARAFVPVALIASGANVLVVNPALPVHSVEELIALAKAKPGQLNYASAGIGTFQHLGAELFRSMTGVEIVHVPFKGGGPAMGDVIAGNTQIMFSSIVQTLPLIRAGKLRALAVGSLKRAPVMADVPTLDESGVRGYEANNWWGIMAPTGTPAAVVRRLHDEVKAVVGTAETRKRFSDEAIEARDMAPEEFGRYIAEETAKWARVIKQANIKAD
jgi:tripartite-type tricarboxylate transporter receptor subunit TctC